MENELKTGVDAIPANGYLNIDPFVKVLTEMGLIEKYLQHISEMYGHVALDDGSISQSSVKFTEAELKHLRSFQFID